MNVRVKFLRLLSQPYTSAQTGSDTLRKGVIAYAPYLNSITSAFYNAFHDSSFLETYNEGFAYLLHNIRRIRNTSEFFNEARN